MLGRKSGYYIRIPSRHWRPPRRSTAGSSIIPRLRPPPHGLAFILKNTLKTAFGWLVFAAIVLGGLEIALRQMPELIPLTLLKRFHHEPRLAIAQKRQLWNDSQMWVLERDDGGPTLKLFKPFSKIVWDFHGPEGTAKGVTLMDDQGFCNPPRDSYDRKQIDIIAVGDSFTWCIATDPEANWISQLGQLTGLSVYNLGRGGIGPYDYLQILKHFGLPKHPRYVVMNIYEGNDLRDSRRYRQHIEAARHGRVLFRNAADRSIREIDIDAVLGDSPLRNSYALNFVLAAIDKGYEGGKNVVLRATGGDAPARVDFHYKLKFDGATVPFNIQNADESEVRYARMLKNGRIDFSPFDEALANFAALARQHGFTPVLAYSPSAYTGYADFVAFDDPALAELMPGFSRSQRAYLAGKAQELGLVFVDTTPAMQAAGRRLQAGELLYDPVNVHYTIRGNRVFAEALAAAIARLQQGDGTPAP